MEKNRDSRNRPTHTQSNDLRQRCQNNSMTGESFSTNGARNTEYLGKEKNNTQLPQIGPYIPPPKENPHES